MKNFEGRVCVYDELHSKGRIKRILKGKGDLMFHKVFFQKGLVKLNDKKLKCRRCQMKFSDKLGRLDIKDMYYCPYCLQFERITNQINLYYLPLKRVVKDKKNQLVWKGKLSIFQQKISLKLENENKNNQLIWAVTGAGKTEMLYSVINKYLTCGKRVCYAAPRIDVVKELGERFKKVFPFLKIPVLYHKSPDKYFLSSFIVATIHQLVRFENCFDLIVIDEMDAFPYAGNRFLNKQVKKSLNLRGRIIYLTATLNNQLDKKCDILQLPLRYHLKPLVVPKYQFLFQSYFYLEKKIIPSCLKKYFKKLKRQVLVFFPNILQMKQWCELFQKNYPKLIIKSVSSKEIDRLLIIEEMRQKKINILCTTAILERGITFPNIDVWIFDAHHSIFTRQAIVQIAGRVGRHQKFPDGEVILIAEGKTKAMIEAINEIKKMNQSAKRWLDDAMPNL